MLFDRSLFDALRHAPITEGARAVVHANADRIVNVAVDDEEHITELVAMGLGYNGFDVARAGSGREALEANLDQCWDLLRQRRARREFGQDPSAAAARDESTVEHYQQ